VPAYGSAKGYSLYGNQNNDSIFLVGYKAKSWSSVVAEQSNRYETVSSNGYKSIPAATAKPLSGEAQMVWRLAYASVPGSVAAVLQGAMDDVDGEYVTVDSSSNAAGETRTIASPYRFHRIYFTTAPNVGTIVEVGTV
jgi:uncharacterized iron-regulated membrane protein